jgi:hypothetical protein
MQARAFWRIVAVDRSDLLDQLLELFHDESARFCVIGGLAVNAYAEPVVTLDLDIVVAVPDLPAIELKLAERFRVERFHHSVNVSHPDSHLRVQIQTDPRYAPFVERAERREILGMIMPVARAEDVLAGKIWAVQDGGRRPSKRQKDLADIARLLEFDPTLRRHVPDDVLARLV